MVYRTCGARLASAAFFLPLGSNPGMPMHTFALFVHTERGILAHVCSPACIIFVLHCLVLTFFIPETTISRSPLDIFSSAFFADLPGAAAATGICRINEGALDVSTGTHTHDVCECTNNANTLGRFQ